MILRAGEGAVASRRLIRPGASCRHLQGARQASPFGSACRGLIVALVVLMCSSGARADSDATIAEYRIKAAFLLKFVGFIDWPAAAFDRSDAPLVIGVLGGETLGNELEQIASGRQVNGHPIRVRRLGRGDPSTGLHALFVGRTEGTRLGAIAAASDAATLLMVSESETALAQGSAINFVVVDDKVRFDVALRSINRAGLKISARLLAVARLVQPDPS